MRGRSPTAATTAFAAVATASGGQLPAHLLQSSLNHEVPEPVTLEYDDSDADADEECLFGRSFYFLLLGLLVAIIRDMLTWDDLTFEDNWFKVEDCIAFGNQYFLAGPQVE